MPRLYVHLTIKPFAYINESLEFPHGGGRGKCNKDAEAPKAEEFRCRHVTYLRQISGIRLLIRRKSRPRRVCAGQNRQITKAGQIGKSGVEKDSIIKVRSEVIPFVPYQSQRKTADKKRLGTNIGSLVHIMLRSKVTLPEK